MYCHDCGYPLAPAGGDVCPECGLGFDAADPRSWSPVAPSRTAWLAVRLRHAVAIALVATLVVVGWNMLGLDQWAGISRSPWFLIAGLVIGGSVVSLARSIGRSRWYLAPAAPFAAFLLFLVLFDVSRIKPLLRALDEMTPGTTHAEAKAIMDAHFPANGRFPRPVLDEDEPDRLRWRVDPSHQAYNAAVAIVRIDPDDDTVVATDFSPD